MNAPAATVTANTHRGSVTLTALKSGDDGLIPDTHMTILAVSFGQRLNPQQANHLAGLTGYVWRSLMAGRPLDQYRHDPEPGDLLVFDAITLRMKRSDPVYAWSRFADQLTEYVAQGTPVRKTDRSGPGTAGTRLLPGFGPEAAATLTVYADAVIPVSSAALLQAMSGTLAHI